MRGVGKGTSSSYRRRACLCAAGIFAASSAAASPTESAPAATGPASIRWGQYRGGAHPLQIPLGVPSDDTGPSQDEPAVRTAANDELHIYPSPGLHAGHTALDSQQKGVVQPLTLFASPTEFDLQAVTARVSKVKRREWDDVMNGCSYTSRKKGGVDLKGGIEACEASDLDEVVRGKGSSAEEFASALESVIFPYNVTASASTIDPASCWPHASTLDGRALFGASLAPKSRDHRDGDTPVAGPPKEQLTTPACKLIEQMLGRRHHGAPKSSRAGDSDEPHLFSFVLTFTVPHKRTSPTRDPPPPITRSFWLGHLHIPEQSAARGLWPLAGNAHDETSGEVKWTGRQINRIAGMMYDPYIPYTEQKRGGWGWPPAAAWSHRDAEADMDDKEGLGAADNLDGVGVSQARFNLGLSIRAPFNTREDDPPLEPVHAPVAGQVVWQGRFVRAERGSGRRGAPRGEADQGHAVSIRDEWGFVWHLTGLEADSVRTSLGEDVQVGQVLGKVTRQGNGAPSARASQKADPYRFKSLRILVARPAPRWRKWPNPFARGWTYYDPLHFLLNEYDEDNALTAQRKGLAAPGQTHTQQWRSTIPPDAIPARIFFAPAVLHPLNMSLQVMGTSTDVTTPTLSGRVQILAAFDAFAQTPGDGDDAMDGTGLYSLQWGVIRGFQDQEPDWDPNFCEFFGNELDGSEWRVAFEHDKITPTPLSTGADPVSVFARIGAAFEQGRFFKKRFYSAFDEKERHVYYAPTRHLHGQPDIHGAWDTRREANGNGPYTVMVRAIDYWGNVGCISSNVVLRNSRIGYGNPPA